jgi:hypothetical protein
MPTGYPQLKSARDPHVAARSFPLHTIILASCNRYVLTTEVTSGTIVHRAKPTKRLAAQIEFWICIVLYGKACVG